MNLCEKTIVYSFNQIFKKEEVLVQEIESWQTFPGSTSKFDWTIFKLKPYDTIVSPFSRPFFKQIRDLIVIFFHTIKKMRYHKFASIW